IKQYVDMDASCATARKEKEEREYISMRMRRWLKESWNPNEDKKDLYTDRTWKTNELNDKLPVIADDGIIKLTRRVVSVEREHGELKVSATTWCANDEQDAMTNDIVFTPRFAGRSCGVLNVGTCKIQITVAWSLFDW
uniref:DUF6598 domain-containing protein n=1 Tax=Aegilops tauschii subsp. strangulata TaxID=200361 RepID=A0A453E042_AEGTS